MRVRLTLPPKRSLVRPVLQVLHAGLLLVGVAGVSTFAWLQVERSYFGQQYLQEFERMTTAQESPVLAAAVASAAADEIIPEPTPAPPASTRAQAAPLTGAPVLARLRIERLGLEAPVLEGVDNRALRRGAGWIPGTARPGEPGNVGIAAHRDTFFRPLRDVRSGDRIELDLPGASRTYIVQSVYVVEPDFEGALDASDKPTLTLVTCFPFNFIGTAPRRYIVRAALADD